MVNELVRRIGEVEKVEVSRRRSLGFRVGRLLQVYVSARETTNPDNAIVEGVVPYDKDLLTMVWSYAKKLFLPHAKLDLKISISDGNSGVYA